MPDDCRSNRPGNEPNQDVLSLLEETMERARAGEIRSVAIALEAGDMTSTAYELGSGGDRAHLGFAVDHLKLRLLTEGE